jgi:NRPS condensation-like uncharacterized protein
MAGNGKWYELDNAAKIIPATVQGADTRVFRLSCELKEEVDSEVLQHALDKTIRQFPHFNCILKKGLFWYYLEYSSQKARVCEEHLPPCSAIYTAGKKDLLFRLHYYKTRIVLEMFHVLTDGTGAFVFFKNIVIRYLVEKHHLDESIQPEERSSVSEKTGDAFDHFYSARKSRLVLKEQMPRRAYQLKGEKNENLELQLLEGTVSVKKLLDAAHRYNSTIAVFSVALYVEAIIQEMAVRERKLPVVITVPVNLRNYFPSQTTRNFFGVINVAFDPEKYDGTLESIVEDIRNSFEEQLSEEQIFHTMNAYAALEHNWAVKMVPLVFKDLGISAINFLRQRGVTSSISNVGKVNMPEALVPYIDRFSSFMSSRSTQICISSFQDRLTFGAVTAFTSHGMLARFFRRLVELDIPVELATTDYDH